MYGLPRRLISDRGTCFTSKLFEELCSELGIEHILTSSRHPQANGQVERSHSILMTTLMTSSDMFSEWDEMLAEVQTSINCSESKVTTRTPFEMLHGYRPRFKLGRLRELSTTTDVWEPPEELRESARQKLESEQARMKLEYDKRRHDNIRYVVDEIVVMKRSPTATGESTKLQDRYRGPLIVTEVLPGDVYRVAELAEGERSRFATTAHVSQLKSWRLPVEDEHSVNDDVEVEEGRPTRTRRPPVWKKDYC